MKKSIPRHIIVKAQNAKDKAKIWGKKKKHQEKGLNHELESTTGIQKTVKHYI